MKEEIIGAMSALITPFKNDKIDFVSYEKIIKRQIKYKMDACVPTGTTGESTTLSHKEHMDCIKVAVDVCKNTGTKVLAGAGSNSTREAIELAQFAQKSGADGILCVTPYYNKPTQEGLYQHFISIANSIDIPVLLYNIPSRTGVSIEVSTMKRLNEVNKNIYGVKEASGDIERVVEIKSKIKDFKVLSGEDSINQPILSSGGCGVISVTGNLLPDRIVNLVKYANENKQNECLKESIELFEINKVLFCETNPIPIKTAMFLCGLIDSLEFRLPLSPMKKENIALLENILQKYEVKE
ncbi:4-hydroxy-tetrahydrodipicolinate synthase [Helicobacter sp. MIT 14-3879]|uniref:4-hydroxy-tetrahydrodipicolinate synthase n=1 Tax=Helicobacter sp. MIT 14-3879 TaxID=2040649 RepID=UPI000E1F2795|nr:4-hydroxy-tetrahydrodipicolinate synthase [Helicobacter sp. MIT 14-3879]RDU65063.1 4-hydroxy-tetrahydrodipicolinate synthase [Helicobacter sp. MIT 14-3879]